MVTPVGATFRPPRVTPLYSTPVLAGGLYGGFGGVVATPVYRSTPVFSTSAVGIRAPRVARSVGPRTNAAASAFRIRSAVGGGRRARQDPMLSRATAHAASIRARYAAD